MCSKPFDFSWEKAHIRGAPIPKPELQRLMYEEMLFFRGVDAPSSGVAVPRPVFREGEEEEAKGMETDGEVAVQEQEQQAQADAVAANNLNGAEAAAAAQAAASSSPAPATAPAAREAAVEGTGEVATSEADGQHLHQRGPSKPARTTPPAPPRKGSRNNDEAEAGNEAAEADRDAMSVVEGEQP